MYKEERRKDGEKEADKRNLVLLSWVVKAKSWGMS